MSEGRDWISIIAIAVILSCASVTLIVFYNMRFRECVADPLIYASKFYEEKTGVPFQGSGYFITDGKTDSPIIYFDSKEVVAEWKGDGNPMYQNLPDLNFAEVNIFNSSE